MLPSWNSVGEVVVLNGGRMLLRGMVFSAAIGMGVDCSAHATVFIASPLAALLVH